MAPCKRHSSRSTVLDSPDEQGLLPSSGPSRSAICNGAGNLGLGGPMELSSVSMVRYNCRSGQSSEPGDGHEASAEGRRRPLNVERWRCTVLELSECRSTGELQTYSIKTHMSCYAERRISPAVAIVCSRRRRIKVPNLKLTPRSRHLSPPHGTVTHLGSPCRPSQIRSRLALLALPPVFLLGEAKERPVVCLGREPHIRKQSGALAMAEVTIQSCYSATVSGRRST